MQVSLRPTSLGDLRQTSLQAGGLYKRPHVASPPLTINTGGGVPAPPSGYVWRYVTDASGRQRIETYFDSAMGVDRPIMQRVA